ncbi:HTTM domain-containing protein [Granulicella tundricola]|uniref:HTTM domain protein n=1 Tax=Granulicella tundricola (strain ATCC BAA-1859 / DSM 23138 / MP5ACTX9) TaxID=1198114 RepID=E8WZC6_GRATM|nr:HTTM domain-containing protein [Granulicella tundricola]ADW68814.1 HTTM domain protein [Granulicella tundricola MP5ACTX9]
MTFSSLRTSLTEYLFKPVSPWPAAVYRILFGLCVCATLLLLHGDWSNWFGVHGWITPDTIDQAETGFRLNLFALAPHSERWVTALYYLILGASITLTLGLGTRVSSVIVYLGLNALNQRNPIILHGGDTFLRSAAFFLIFASSAEVLSLDSLIRRYRKPSESVPRLISPWPLRLIQYQLALLYLASFWWKAHGNTWWNGTALYYVVNLGEVRRFPIPHILHTAWVLRLGGWCAMAFELLFPCLVWFKRFRNPILIAGLLFHLSLEYALNVPMFQWEVLSAYVLFLNFGERPTQTTR